MDNTVIIGVLTLIAGWVTARYKYKGDQQAVSKNADTEVQGHYINSMELILKTYEKQLEGFRHELEVVKLDNAEMKREFAEFREQHYKKMTEYKEYIAFLEEENEDLKNELNDLKVESAYAKGELDESNK